MAWSRRDDHCQACFGQCGDGCVDQCATSPGFSAAPPPWRSRQPSRGLCLHRGRLTPWQMRLLLNIYRNRLTVHENVDDSTII